eukprot:4437466-Amphidinium_carterae.1
MSNLYLANTKPMHLGNHLDKKQSFITSTTWIRPVGSIAKAWRCFHVLEWDLCTFASCPIAVFSRSSVTAHALRWRKLAAEVVPV